MDHLDRRQRQRQKNIHRQKNLIYANMLRQNNIQILTAYQTDLIPKQKTKN
jgi:hypothetical protein